jgi:hypothetical protein
MLSSDLEEIHETILDYIQQCEQWQASLFEIESRLSTAIERAREQEIADFYRRERV